jgi:16S rRNA (uracil1498-N3)-methyltransferase
MEPTPLKFPRVYVSSEHLSQDYVTFPANVAHYVKNVLRLHSGDHIEVFDGDHLYGVKLKIVGTEIQGEIVSSTDMSDHSDPDITLAFGCVRPGPFQEILRHGTELGVNRFIPLITRRTTRRPESKKNRWETILISAVSQSGRFGMPEVEEPVEFDTFISDKLSQTNKYVLSVRNSARPFWEVLKEDSDNNAILLVGPEGGFDEYEEEVAISAAYVPVRLSGNTLRTETAAIVGVGLIVARFGCFNKDLK